MGHPARGTEVSHVVPVRLTIEEVAAVMVRAKREHLNRSEANRVRFFRLGFDAQGRLLELVVLVWDDSSE